jgi:ribosomal protein L21
MDKMVASIKDEELKLEVEKIIFRIDTAKINVGNLFMTHRNISAEVQKDLEQLKIWVNQLSESTFHLSMLVRKEIHPNNIDLKITKIHKNVEGVEGEM